MKPQDNQTNEHGESWYEKPTYSQTNNEGNEASFFDDDNWGWETSDGFNDLGD